MNAIKFHQTAILLNEKHVAIQLKFIELGTNITDHWSAIVNISHRV